MTPPWGLTHATEAVSGLLYEHGRIPLWPAMLNKASTAAQSATFRDLHSWKEMTCDLLELPSLDPRLC
jgi:hypothetical protein